MASEKLVEIRALDRWRIAALFGAGRLAYGLLAVFFALVDPAPDGRDFSVIQELLIQPGAWFGIAAFIVFAFNKLSPLSGGLRLRLVEGVTLVEDRKEEEATTVEWSYFDAAGKEQGPFDDQAFRGLIDRGVVGADTRVSRAVRNLVTELILEDKTRPARAHPELTARLRSAAAARDEAAEAPVPSQDAAEA